MFYLKLIVFTTVFSLPWSVFGFGVGFSSSFGLEQWKDTCCPDDDYDHTADRNYSNAGFVVDTAVAKNRLFNYRFTLSKETHRVRHDGLGLKMRGLSYIHDFAYSVYRNEKLRVWLGPRIKISVFDDLQQTQSPSSNSTFGEVEGFGFGPVVGVNLHLDQWASLALSAGFLDLEYDGQYSAYDPGGTIVGQNKVESDSISTFISFSVIFRIDDRY